MSSRVILPALFVLVSIAAAAQDWGDFARQSDSSQDPLLIELLRESDLDEAMRICEGVAAREDVAVGTIVSWIASSRTGRGQARVEALLRLLLARLLDPLRPGPPLERRVAANEAAILSLFETGADWRDPLLIAEAVRVLPLMTGKGMRPVLMATGVRVTETLRGGRGRLTAPEAALAMDFLTAVRRLGDPDFLAPCAAIAALSRDEAVVAAARAAAAALAGST
jgi:hypothetical protein